MHQTPLLLPWRPNLPSRIPQSICTCAHWAIWSSLSLSVRRLARAAPQSHKCLFFSLMSNPSASNKLIGKGSGIGASSESWITFSVNTPFSFAVPTGSSIVPAHFAPPPMPVQDGPEAYYPGFFVQIHWSWCFPGFLKWCLAAAFRRNHLPRQYLPPHRLRRRRSQ